MSTNTQAAEVVAALRTGVAASNMWDDTTIELNDSNVRTSIPALPKIAEDVQVMKGGGIETLAYMALQVKKTRSRDILMRAVASACSWLFKDGHNYTGSQTKLEEITGLSEAFAEDADFAALVVTNFRDAEQVTVGELQAAASIDEDELGAYIGWIFYASQKQATDLNLSAFNEKRRSAATATLIEDPVIFVADSEWLDRDIARKCYGSFLSFSPYRAHMITRVLVHLDAGLTGPALSFMTIFLLLVDSGMSALKIIKEAVLRHKWILTAFPELKPDLEAANKAQQIIRLASGRERSFLKAIHGNNFVPVNYSQIDNLAGVCKEILKRTTPSYQNYGGGRITESQLSIINQNLGTQSKLSASVNAE